MMKAMLFATLAVLGAVSPALAQTDPAAARALPLAEGVTQAPDCGGVALATPSVCLQTTFVNLQPTFDTYADFLGQQGWVGVGVIENGLVMSRPREGGGCDGMQLVAFIATEQAPTASTPAYLAFSPIPGDICTQSPPAP